MNMSNDDDWRLAGQEKYLTGVTLLLRKYEPPSAEWDHDHCDFCWTKFCQHYEPGTLQRGYSTIDSKHWICMNCFRDFCGTFHFELVETSPDIGGVALSTEAPPPGATAGLPSSAPISQE